MKYKVGDRVRIKTWEELRKEFRLSSSGSVFGNVSRDVFTKGMEKNVNDASLDRILIIANVYSDYYHMEDMGNIWHDYIWHDYMIKGLVVKKYVILEPIESRFELMDFELMDFEL